MKLIKKHTMYSCPDCGSRIWPAGDDFRDIHRCLCDGGVWRWNGEDWEWVAEEITETGGIL